MCITALRWRWIRFFFSRLFQWSLKTRNRLHFWKIIAIEKNGSFREIIVLFFVVKSILMHRHNVSDGDYMIRSVQSLLTTEKSLILRDKNVSIVKLFPWDWRRTRMIPTKQTECILRAFMKESSSFTTWCWCASGYSIFEFFQLWFCYFKTKNSKEESFPAIIFSGSKTQNLMFSICVLCRRTVQTTKIPKRYHHSNVKSVVQNFKHRR